MSPLRRARLSRESDQSRASRLRVGYRILEFEAEELAVGPYVEAVAVNARHASVHGSLAANVAAIVAQGVRVIGVHVLENVRFLFGEAVGRRPEIVFGNPADVAE